MGFEGSGVDDEVSIFGTSVLVRSGVVVSGRVVSGREVGGLESVRSGRFSKVVVVARLVRLVVAPTGDPTDTRAIPTATTVAVASVVHRVAVM